MKILSMFMVLLLHILGHGGILYGTTQGSLQYHVAWGIEIAAYCAVNVFAMTSGYLLINRKWKASRVISIWLQVVFYALSINLVFAIIKPKSVGLIVWVQALFPVSSNLWWYFTAYFALLFLMPFINKIMAFFSKKQARNFILIVLIFFSGIITIGGVLGKDFNPFKLFDGYSLVWLAIMYFIGGYVRKYGFMENIKRRWLALIYAGCVLCVWASRIIIEWATIKVFGVAQWVQLFVSYTSPFVVIMSVCLLLLFSRIRFPKKINKILATVSPLTFAVYIIHEYSLIKNNLIIGQFTGFLSKNVFVMVGLIFLTAIVIFTVCILIEWLRTLLFKVTKIDKLTQKLGKKIDDKIDFYEEKKKEENS